ncbi:MAG TPA: hypothetical protein VFU15_03750 [Bacteroidia bacterium]|nr:hypothetical protein [Bacteroidia bacterium]
MRYSEAPLILRILAWPVIAGCGFVVFHALMLYLGYDAETWVKEIYITLQNGLPFFLFLTGSFVRDKKFRIPLLLFFPLFIACYFINMLYEYDVIGFGVTQWIIGPAELGLFLTYLFFFILEKKKNVTSVLKILWFFCITWAYLVPKFTTGFHAGSFFLASIFIFPFLMGFGLYDFFRKPIAS